MFENAKVDLLVILFVLLAFAAPASEIQERVWTDNGGTHRVEAKFIESDGNTVVLKKADGRLITLSIDRLSQSDRDYISTLKNPESIPPGANDTPSIASIQESASAKLLKGRAGDYPSDLAEKVEQSVVQIKTDVKRGSGFVVDSKGIIVTNYHVVEGATTASVKFRDGTRFDVLGYIAVSSGKDLALLRINPKTTLPALMLSKKIPRKLDLVIASGSPEGFGFSTSQGTISAIRTGVEIHDIFNEIGKTGLYELLRYDLDATWIQTTTAISHGSSGGPLTDTLANVIGVNTWSEPDGQNLNFAISAIEVANLMRTASNESRALDTLPKPPKHQRLARTPGHEHVPITREQYRIEFPSGKALTEGSFVTNIHGVTQWLDRVYGSDGKRGSVAFLRHANGKIFAISSHERGILNGITMAFYDNKDPMVYAMYVDGCRHGIVKTWDVAGNTAYWAEYSKGKRNGLCCLFKDDRLRMVLEYRFDKAEAVHLISANQVAKTFTTTALAALDETAKSALADLDKIETQMVQNERDFKKTIKNEEMKKRQALASQAGPQKRAAIQSRINQHSNEKAEFINALKRQANN